MAAKKKAAHWSRKLRLLRACVEAVEFAKTQKTFAAAWKTCSRGDWMLWIAGRLSGPPESDARKKLVLAACACARLALKHVKPGEERPRICIETTEKWARGEDGITTDDVRKAGSAAYAADAAAYDAAYAAAAAAYASAAAYAAAAYAADAAYAAAYSAAAAAARSRMLAECADIVRTMYPAPPKLTKKEDAS